MLISKISLFYGETESGKTTLIKDILKKIKYKIPSCILICPKYE